MYTYPLMHVIHPGTHVPSWIHAVSPDACISWCVIPADAWNKYVLIHVMPPPAVQLWRGGRVICEHHRRNVKLFLTSSHLHFIGLEGSATGGSASSWSTPKHKRTRNWRFKLCPMTLLDNDLCRSSASSSTAESPRRCDTKKYVERQQGYGNRTESVWDGTSDEEACRLFSSWLRRLILQLTTSLLDAQKVTLIYTRLDSPLD